MPLRLSEILYATMKDLTPYALRLSVEIRYVGKIMCLDEASEVPYYPFHAPFLIGPARCAGMDSKVIMGREVEELGIQDEFGPSSDDQ